MLTEKRSLKANIGGSVFIGVIVIVLSIFIQFFTGVKWASAVEEPLKFAGLQLNKLPMVPYVWTVATLFTVLEYAINFQSVVQDGPLFMFIRLLPHYLFAAVFLLGAKKSRWLGFALALAAHSIWNAIVLIY